MYRLNDEYKELVLNKFKITKIAEEIGVSRPYLSNIINQNICCSKPIAFSITKYISKELEIEDTFTKIC